MNSYDGYDYSIDDKWFELVAKEMKDSVKVAQIDEKIVGLTTCIVYPDDKKAASVNIAVDPFHRNKGIGSLLYDELINYANSKGLEHIETVIKGGLDYSIRFAKNRGFNESIYSWKMEKDISNISVIKETKDFYLVKGEFSDGKKYVDLINRNFNLNIKEEAYLLSLKDPSIRVYFLVEANEVIGTATIQIRENIKTGYIYDIIIDKPYRGKGKGKNLLELCINKLHNANINKATLLVDGENENALSLYKKIGFEKTETHILFTKLL